MKWIPPGLILLSLIGVIAHCTNIPPNCPYILQEISQNGYFSTIGNGTMNLDPQETYSGFDSPFLALQYEPLLTYHYLKRPYSLVPLTCTQIPTPMYYSKQGTNLTATAPAEEIAYVEYRFELKPNIYYHDHPCFAKREDGSYYYHHLSYDDIAGFRDINQFTHTGTRELVADDYKTMFLRIADPRTNCPLLPKLKSLIRGLGELNASISTALDKERAQRKKRIGPLYNQERNERQHPIPIDRTVFAFSGFKKHSKYEFSIYINKKYPAFLYLLAMHFFSPVPIEAEWFYEQGPMIRQNILFKKYPVGTGPYYIERLDPNMELVLRKNPRYNHYLYPQEGTPEDYANGLLQDAGKPLPFLERLVFKLEKEPTTRWTKFLQGYYDQSSLSADTFDQVIQFGAQSTEMATTDFLDEHNIQLHTSPTLTLWYYAFNMDDPVWGGLSEARCKMRQAISIALNLEEKLMIFDNGIGEVAMSPVPSNLRTYLQGEQGINPYTHTWNQNLQQPKRLDLEYAQHLLAEAGWEKGINSEGEQLTLYYDNAAGVNSKSIIWMRKQIEPLNIKFIARSTDWARLMDKVESSSYTFTDHGWAADFPDPENFLFLFNCPNYTEEMSDPDWDCNNRRYNNPRFNALFKKLQSTEFGSKRDELVQECIAILQHDAPWVFGHTPYNYSLTHNWVQNDKPAILGTNPLKFIRLDWEQRLDTIRKSNKPMYTPLLFLLLLLVAFIMPVVIAFRLREKGKL